MHAITLFVVVWNVIDKADIWVIYQIVRMIQPFHSGSVAIVVSVSATPSGKSQPGSSVVIISVSYGYTRPPMQTCTGVEI